MKNLAGLPVEETEAQCKAELEAAGIEVYQLPKIFAERQIEVKSGIMGQINAWGFTRAWYYWVAKGPGLPPAHAEALHKEWGDVVRVDGHCAAPSPREWFHGFAVGHYHVDTQEGLNALAAMIKQIYEDALVEGVGT